MKMDDVLLCGAILILVALLAYKHRTLPRADVADNGMGIDELVQCVKAELVKADEDTRKLKQAPTFRVSGFDLELNFVVKNRNTVKGGLQTELIAVGSEAEVASEKVQKITLHMLPLEPENGSQSATSVTVSADKTQSRVIGAQPPPKAQSERVLGRDKEKVE